MGRSKSKNDNDDDDDEGLLVVTSEAGRSSNDRPAVAACALSGFNSHPALPPFVGKMYRRGVSMMPVVDD